MTRLLLVRHGESTWNAERRWQGRADPPLSARGEAQSHAAARSAAAAGEFAMVVTSTLARARQTAAPIGEALGAVPVGDDALVERAAGAWEGLTRPEIEERFPGFLDDGRRPPGYESDESVVARAITALVGHAERGVGGSLLVVTHGGVIHALERRHTDEWRRLDNLAGRWFALDGVDRPEVVPVGDRVSLLPDTAPVPDPPDRADRHDA